MKKRPPPKAKRAKAVDLNPLSPDTGEPADFDTDKVAEFSVDLSAWKGIL